MSWFKIVNVGGNRARLDIYDAIGESVDWWTGEKSGVAARDFSSALRALGDIEEIDLHINSPGGSVVDGWQIFNELRRHPALKNVYIDGQAASMASVIAMVGDTVIMPENATLWVHNPMATFAAWTTGYSDDMRKIARDAMHLADDLDITGESLLNAYVKRSNGKVDKDRMKSLMDAETLITAEMAVELGLADELEVPIDQAASFDIAKIMGEQKNHLRAAIDKVKETASKPPKVTPSQTPVEPIAMDAKAVISACADAGFPLLANQMISCDMTPDAVRERLSMAAKVKNRVVAGGMDDMESELVNLALTQPVDEIMGFMIAMKREQFDADIDSHLSAGGGKPEPKINTKSIYDARRVDGVRIQ